MNPYEILKVGPNATDEEIKIAYRRLALKTHPDLYPSNREEMTAKFRVTEEAYKAIETEDKRKKLKQKSGATLRYGAVNAFASFAHNLFRTKEED